EEARKMPILNDILDHEVLGREYKRGLQQGELTVLRRQIEKRFGSIRFPPGPRNNWRDCQRRSWKTSAYACWTPTPWKSSCDPDVRSVPATSASRLSHAGHRKVGLLVLD